MSYLLYFLIVVFAAATGGSVVRGHGGGVLGFGAIIGCLWFCAIHFNVPGPAF